MLRNHRLTSELDSGLSTRLVNLPFITLLVLSLVVLPEPDDDDIDKQNAHVVTKVRYRQNKSS